MFLPFIYLFLTINFLSNFLHFFTSIVSSSLGSHLSLNLQPRLLHLLIRLDVPNHVHATAVELVLRLAVVAGQVGSGVALVLVGRAPRNVLLLEGGGDHLQAHLSVAGPCPGAPPSARLVTRSAPSPATCQCRARR